MKHHKADVPKSSPLVKKGEKGKPSVNHTRSGAGEQQKIVKTSRNVVPPMKPGKSEYGLPHGVRCPAVTSAGGCRHSGVTQKEHDRAYGRGK
jgi:hypothetical protein